MSTVDMTSLQAWIGRQETRTDVVAPAPLAGLSATLDYASTRVAAGEPLPLPWHWLYFLAPSAASEIAVDGHPLRGDFLPPVTLPRRMWAGGSIRVKCPLSIGDAIRKISTITDISHKQGTGGDLVFVTVQHQIYRGDSLAIEEQQDLVYREASTGAVSAPAREAPATAQWSRQILPDPVLLFRYSALTFNSHRIHYDRDYAVQNEGYDGLVVQGPLTATLLLDLLYRELAGEQVETFRFRGVRPLLDTAPFRIQGCRQGRAVKLWALDEAGALAMDAQAGLL